DRALGGGAAVAARGAGGVAVAGGALPAAGAARLGGWPRSDRVRLAAPARAGASGNGLAGGGGAGRGGRASGVAAAHRFFARGRRRQLRSGLLRAGGRLAGR